MIVKFHKHGNGAGKGPMDYLLLTKGKPRSMARVMRGDPDLLVRQIDELPFKFKYTSGLLAFDVKDSNLSEEFKHHLMDAFEDALLPGLAPDQYNIAWVEHTDKGFLELNFVVSNVENRSGKALTVYLQKNDVYRIDAFKTWVNAKYDFQDPNDPKKKRQLQKGSSLPKKVAEARLAMHAHVEACVLDGRVTDRASLIKSLEGLGLTIAKQTKYSISIKVKGKGRRNIRLKGSYYEENFDGSIGESQVEAASKLFAEQRLERRDASAKNFLSRYEHKKNKLAERYGALDDYNPKEITHYERQQPLNQRNTPGFVESIRRRVELAKQAIRKANRSARQTFRSITRAAKRALQASAQRQRTQEDDTARRRARSLLAMSKMQQKHYGSGLKHHNGVSPSNTNASLLHPTAQRR